MDGVDKAPAHTILWVRRCSGCASIDHRDWFDTEELAQERDWFCRMCKSAAYTLLRTRW